MNGFSRSIVLISADYVVRSINLGAQALMGSGKYSNEAPPDPLVLFQLQNEVYRNANVFAFQKAFAGSGMTNGRKWGFDVYYESLDGFEEEEEHGMTCKYS